MRRGALAVLALAAVLAAVGLVDRADNVTHRVLVLADGVGWADAWRPFWMPAPIEAWALRPLSVLLLKAHVAVWGATGSPAAWYEWLRAALELSVFGLGALAWLRAAGLERVAAWAACSSMVLAPTLFQAWYVPELDLLGAGATLMGSALLLRPRPLGGRWVAVVACLAVPLLLKEATSIVLFGFLGAGVLVGVRRGDRAWLGRQAVATLAALGVWLLLFTPLLTAPRGEVATVGLAEKLPLVEANLVQLAYLLGPLGAGLLVVGRFRARWLPWALLGGAALLPPLSFYSHYEAIYVAPRWIGGLWIALLVVGLVGVHRTRREDGELLAALTIGLVVLGLSLAGLVGPSAREDMASRIFVALAPLLHGLAMAAALRVGSAGVGALAVCAGWWVLASGVNYSLDWQARHAADVVGKRALATEELSGDLLLFNHYVEWLDPWALVAAGAGEDAHDALYVHAPAWLPKSRYADAGWIWQAEGEPDVLGHTGDAWLYWLVPRSQMSAAAGEALEGDLSWTRREAGLFTPILPGGANRPEDHRAAIYRPGPSELELLAERGVLTASAEVGFVQLPWMLTELPRRVVGDVPVLERYAYELRLWELPLR